jgi:hypothetical protein
MQDRIHPAFQPVTRGRKGHLKVVMIWQPFRLRRAVVEVDI